MTEEPVRLHRGDKFLGLDLSAHLLPKYRSQVRAWRANGATVHLIVYDLLPLERPEWFTPRAGDHFRDWFRMLSFETDQAICISDQVRRELTNRLASVGVVRKPSIARLRLGADIAGTVPSSGVCNDLKRTLERLRFRPAILMVGTIEPRKGYEVALKAFDHLWQSWADAPDLVLVGKSGWMTDGIQCHIRSHPEFGRRLHWFDRMSDEGLCFLYDACRGLLVASRGEGWGLPLVEAATRRRYVLARDLPVFREQGLPNILYFKDDSPVALGAQLLRLASLGRNPAPIVSLPTWLDCVDGLTEAMGIANTGGEAEDLRLRKAS
jgi:glycosyltransferase involved in cell wall biosynthesis